MGSYRGFNYWKIQIAKAKGINLNDLEGFGGSKSWDGIPYPLILNHSDCDGEYTPEQIPELLEELEEIKLLKVDYYEQTDKLIELCKAPHEQNTPIIFM